MTQHSRVGRTLALPPLVMAGPWDVALRNRALAALGRVRTVVSGHEIDIRPVSLRSLPVPASPRCLRLRALGANFTLLADTPSLERLIARVSPGIDVGRGAFALDAALDPLLALAEAALSCEVQLDLGRRPHPPLTGLCLRLGDLEIAFRFGCDEKGLRLLAEAPQPARDAEIVQRVPFSLALSLGRYRLDAAGLVGLATGAIVLPDAGDISSERAELFVQGRRCGVARIGPHTATLEEWAIMPEDTEHETAQPQPQALSSAASLPVDLTFQIEARRCALSEIAGFAPGTVIKLDRRPEDARVDVLANGRLVAFGRLVDVGGRLGVEIVETAGHA